MGNVLIILLVAALLTTGLLVWQQRRRQRTSQRDGSSPFASRLESLALPPEEADVLTAMLNANPAVELDDLLSRRVVYNRAVGVFLEAAKRNHDDLPEVIRVLGQLRPKLHRSAPLHHAVTGTRDLIPGFAAQVVCRRAGMCAGRLWFVNDDQLFVGVERGNVSGFVANRRVQLEVTVSGQGVYVFESRVRTRVDGSRAGIWLEHSENTKNPNRREYLREAVKFRTRVSSAADSAGSEAAHSEALVLNLSGGGIAFLGRGPWRVGQEISLSLPALVHRGMADKVQVRIVRSEERDKVGTHIWGGCFEGLKPAVREAIVKYVQTEHLRRNRL